MSLEFFRDLNRILKDDGVLVVHSDSYDTQSYWSIVKTLKAAGFSHIIPIDDDFSNGDFLEGIIIVSNKPFNFSKLNVNNCTSLLMKKKVLPPIDSIAEVSNPYYISDRINLENAKVNSVYRLNYLDQRRKEFGFVFPLAFFVGSY